jgi:predicted nucleic acid-binding protein
MSVVVDANLVVALFVPLPYSHAAAERFAAWADAGEEILAPTLLEYEVSTALRRAVAAGLLAHKASVETMAHVLALGIRSVPPTPELHGKALAWADRLGRSRAYDSHYLAVAEERRADLWTADRRLARAAEQAGASWVRGVG